VAPNGAEVHTLGTTVLDSSATLGIGWIMRFFSFSKEAFYSNIQLYGIQVPFPLAVVLMNSEVASLLS
jgi:hypothetical protein